MTLLCIKCRFVDCRIDRVKVCVKFREGLSDPINLTSASDETTTATRTDTAVVSGGVRVRLLLYQLLAAERDVAKF